MSWRLLIIGESRTYDDGTPCMCVPVTDRVHDNPGAQATLQQMVCEEFEDRFPRRPICEICWFEATDDKEEC